MSEVLNTMSTRAFVEFVSLFRAEEGRMGVTVTFVAILELLREGLIEIVQSEPFAPIHVRAGAPRPAPTVAEDTEQAGGGPQGSEP
jgi:segregation and condensation protein A